LSKKPEEKVNPLSFLKFGRGDSKMGGINKLLSSDKDNETKTRIPNVLGMTYLDCTGALSSPTRKITLKTEDEGQKTKEITLPKTVEGMSLFFGARYRINAISKTGLSRLEYVDALKSYLAAQAEVMPTAAQARAEEGVKKKT
jgi:hypothetical protein